MTATALDAPAALLGGLFDHAALFPPASLPLDEALAEDERVRGSEGSGLVARFVVPRSRLAELGDAPLRLSVVLDDDGPLPDDPRIEAVETRPRGELAALAGLAPEVYVELEPGDARLEELQPLGLRAKVRCGGARVPAVEELGGFVRACRELGLPFKATAGLHHALPTSGEHGFLNLLAAAAFGDEEAALVETDPGAFGLDGDAFRWRDRAVGAPELAVARRERLVAIGSCSVAEPAAELAALGLLPS